MSETFTSPAEESGKQAERPTPVIPTLGRLREEDCHEFEAILSHRVRHCLQTTGDVEAGRSGAGLHF